MKSIEQLDKNFEIKSKSTRENTAVYNVLDAPFSVHGLIPPSDVGQHYRRIPHDVAQSVSEGVFYLSTHCAGGRARFRTDSRYIAVVARLGAVGKMPHFALTGSAGFDLYGGDRHIATFQPPFNIEHDIFGEVYTDGEMTDYTLNFPLYSEVYEVYVILDDSAIVTAAAPYKYDKPVVFYGSSITQGGCASRPGNCYAAMLSRRLDFDYINLGFSGNARGEDEMAEYVARLDMSVFVFDYDHNAPSAEHLDATHKRFFDIVRASHPHLPIICMTRPDGNLRADDRRKQIIKQTVDSAALYGDSNVYYVDVGEYLRNAGVTDEATVDKIHPNDLGFYHMCKSLEILMKHILLK